MFFQLLLQETNCVLRELDLSYNDIGAEGMEVLGNSLQVSFSNESDYMYTHTLSHTHA